MDAHRSVLVQRRAAVIQAGSCLHTRTQLRGFVHRHIAALDDDRAAWDDDFTAGVVINRLAG
ncbi:hypothetical protein [Desulfosporosinus youngiae]|uniref:hypothetical protein n=1 Tax=Desulfosporosinus youngiae TaxID=339862 RepID=UPI001FA6FDA3|nr:hypothetical protein [Desulfosporosinus youngiae]